MDEQTFRRLSPDAVAGRLDEATYRSWKAAAAQDPERAAFVVRVVEADSRISGVQPSVTPRAEAPARVPKVRALGLAVLFALLGLLAGGLVMNSYLRSRGNQPATATGNAPEPSPLARQDTPAVNREAPANRVELPPVNELEPQPEPEPEPQPEPEPLPAGLVLISAKGDVSVRAARDPSWRRLALNEAVPEGATVNQREGLARFESTSVSIYPHGAFQFELIDGVIRFQQGRFSVRVRDAQAFSCYKECWELERGSFVVEPKTLGGDLWLVEGDALFRNQAGIQVIKPGVRVTLDTARHVTRLTPQQILAHQLETLQPCERLLWWDAETPETTPPFCELAEPGALGDGRAMAHKSGQSGIGVSPSTSVFTAPGSARLRMHVNTSARKLRLELRVQLDEGYRVVDGMIDVPGSGWQVVDVPLDILRAGRFRAENGWLPGREYSALLIAPAVDPDNPLTRNELQIDNLLVYQPR